MPTPEPRRRRSRRYVLVATTPTGGAWRWSSTRPIPPEERATIPAGAVIVRDTAPDPEADRDRT